MTNWGFSQKYEASSTFENQYNSQYQQSKEEKSCIFNICRNALYKIHRNFLFKNFQKSRIFRKEYFQNFFL